MSNPFSQPLEVLATTIAALRPQLIDGIGVEAERFIDNNFRDQGFHGTTFQKWPQRKKPTKGRARAILILSGALRRSFVRTDSADHTTISTDIPYAQVHNEGGTINHPSRAIILNFRNGRGGRLRLSRTRTETDQRRITAIRRANVGEYTQSMPKRQFIGDSPVLTHACEAFIIRKITASIP